MADLSDDLNALRIDRGSSSSSSSSGGGGGLLRTFALLAVILVAGAGAWVLLAPKVEAILFRTEVDVTEIARVSPAQGSVDLTSSGYIIAERVAKIGPVVPGRVAKVHVKEGQVVKAGDLLLELDLADQQAAAATLRARASASEARVAAIRATAAELKQRLDRDRALAEQGTISRAPVDDLAALHQVAEENVKAAAGEAVAAGADARASATTLRHGTLRAPMDGTVVGRPPEVGDVLNPGSFAAAFDLVDLSSLVVEVDVPEARLALAKPGAPGEIVLDAAPDVRLRAQVKAITPRVNRSKATVVVKVAFIDRPALAYPDMAARVSVLAKALDEEARKAPPKTIVPGAAVTERDGSKVVFVIENGKARMQKVKLGPAFGDGFELVSGPSPGTKIVKAPPPVLVDGKAIKERTAG